MSDTSSNAACRPIRKRIGFRTFPYLVAKIERLQSILQFEIKEAKQDYESYTIEQFALSGDPGIYHHIISLQVEVSSLVKCT